MADWYKLSALIVGLGVDPHEALESVFLQRVLCLTTPQPALLSPWDARPPQHAPNSVTGLASFLTRGVVAQTAEWIVLLDRHESHPILLSGP